MNTTVFRNASRLACAIWLAVAGVAAAQTRYEAVHTFSGNKGRPFAPVAQGVDGRLYGSTTAGGFFGKGTIYVADAAGNLATLHEFSGPDGMTPFGRLLVAADGTLFGTTAEGGDFGLGTVFRMTPGGDFSTLVHFDGSNGATPQVALLGAADGTMYGTTPAGGPGGAGTIFSVTPDGAFSIIVAFDGSNGSGPTGELVLGSDGAIYGTTHFGTGGRGSLFRLASDGTLATLVEFTDAGETAETPGLHPDSGVIQASDGNLYGTTSQGGASGKGTLFRFEPATGIFATVAEFTGGEDGGTPSGLRELSDGYLYGTTQVGGAGSAGTLFRLPVDGSTPLQTIFSFSVVDGNFPASGVTQTSDGNAYGTTMFGGPGNYGTIFQVTPDLAVTRIVSFTGAVGADPTGRLVQAGDGNFYGTTSSGGAHGLGTVFRLTPDGLVTTVASFDGDNGAFPSGGLIQASDGHLYGTAEEGGEIGDGTVYRVTLDGTITRLLSFDAFENVGVPIGGVIEGRDGNLYGTTWFGRDFALGGVYRLSLGGSLEVLALFPFDEEIFASEGIAVYPSGSFPSGVIEGPDGLLYGTTETGGELDSGTVFRIEADNSVTTIASFDDANGSYPTGPLFAGSDDNLYGTTSSGGDTGNGTLFQVMLDGTNTVNTLASFDGLNGAFPYHQGLIETGDGVFAGTTMWGGEFDYGTVYQWSAESGITTLHSFDGITGDGPNTTIVKATDGALYGTTVGPQGGVIYRLVSDVVAASLEVTPAAAVYGGSTTLSAALSQSGSPIAGAEIAFTLSGIAVGSAITGADGVAVLPGIAVAGMDAGSYPGAIAASYAGGDGVEAAAAAGDLTIAQATANIVISEATYAYDGVAHVAIATVTGIGGEALGSPAFTYNGSAAAPIEPGSYVVVASYAGSVNYEPATATSRITIVPAQAGLDGLIAAYAFEEGAGNVAGDASGNGNGGVIREAQWTANGRFGHALDFDGVNDWITIQDAAALDIQTAITIEAWVNPRALSGWNTIVLKEGNDRLAYSLYANDWYPRPAGYVNVGGTDRAVIGRSRLPLNTWTHVAMTYSGTMMRLYINGDEVGRRALTGKILASNGPLRIGGNSIWNEEDFDGLIDEVRIYGRELSASEIARDMNSAIAHESVPPSVAIVNPVDGAVLSGMPVVEVSASDNFAVSSVQLQVDGVDAGAAQYAGPFRLKLDAANGTHVITAVARDAAGNVTVSEPITVTIANAAVADYAFNEGSGSVVVDASGRSNNGVMSGGVSRITDSARGRVLSFNGAEGLVSVPDAASLDLTTAMTLEAWVRPTTVDGWRTVLMKEGDGLSYALYSSQDVARPAGYVRVNDRDEAVEGPKRLPTNAWTHLAMTYDGATMRLFVNGVEVESRRQTGPAEVSDGKLRIGGNRVWGEWFRGQIDDVRVYDVAVGSAQIKADMNR